MCSDSCFIPTNLLSFHTGPPGTGKTLTARALANSCTIDGRRVAFFMRKGADCLSKWVGEAERQLRLLFDQAKAHQPSIIFFDEIDGLAPVRSAKQDQIHASIVSTLLALMDGLDSRGQVVVIGATNRIDAIDPALRRPGRFDRELLFGLPTAADRRSIFSIHTKEWEPALSTQLVEEVGELTQGYCGADLKALCTEASLAAVRRSYPQIYESEQKLVVDTDCIRVSRGDLLTAMQAITPASHRTASALAVRLPTTLEPLLASPLEAMVHCVAQIFPPATKVAQQNSKVAQGTATSAARPRQATSTNIVDLLLNQPNAQSHRGAESASSSSSATSSSCLRLLPANSLLCRPRFLVAGDPGMGQQQLVGNGRTLFQPILRHRFEPISADFYVVFWTISIRL